MDCKMGEFSDIHYKYNYLLWVNALSLVSVSRSVIVVQHTDNLTSFSIEFPYIHNYSDTGYTIASI